MKADLRISIKGDPRTHGVNGLKLVDEGINTVVSAKVPASAGKQGSSGKTDRKVTRRIAF